MKTKKPIETISPFYFVAQKYWTENRHYQMRIKDGFPLPKWKDRGKDQMITLSRIQFWIKSGLPPQEEDEHDAWIRLMDLAGWSWGPEYDLIRRKHPMLKPFSVCPKWFQKVTERFIGAVEDYREVLTIYQRDFLT